MTSKAKWTLDSVIRVVVSLGLILSVLGIPAISVPAAQAKVVPQTISEPQSETPPSAQAAAAFDSPLPTPTPLPTVTFISPLPTPQSTVPPTPQATIAPLPVTTTLTLTATQVTVTKLGGHLGSPDHRLQLDIPAGLFQNSTRFKITPKVIDKSRDPAGMIVRFDLEAMDVNTGVSLAEFEQPLTVTLDLRGLIDRSQLKPGEHLALFHETKNPNVPWAEITNAVEIQPGILQTHVSHFSGVGGGSSGDAPAGWQLKYNPPVVSLFSGAATYNYPIAVPTGRHGLQPDVVLGYNTRSVDGVVNVNMEDSDGVPFGWSLDLASISRDRTVTTYHGDWTNQPTTLDLYPTFSLAMNGTNYELIPQNAAANSGRYYAKDVPGLYVWRDNKLSDPGGYSTTPNTSREYWLVKTPDGTTYRLGYQADSEQNYRYDARFLQCMNGGYCGEVGGWAPSRWRVDQITDTLGNQITIGYHSWATDTDLDSLTLTTYHTYPSEIRYNYSNGTATSRVAFTNTDSTKNWINRIDIYNGSLTNLIREYQLGWDDGRVRLLTITQTASSSTQWLPPTTFQHQDLAHGNNGETAPYITQINNGYGGITDISYSTDGRHESIDHTLLFGYSYRVQEVRTSDGINPVAKVDYDYGTPCYDESYTYVPGTVFCRGSSPQTFGPLVGHQTVAVTTYAYDGVTPLNREVHSYNIDDNNSPLRGRELQAQTLDSANTLLTQVNNTYSTVNMTATTFTYQSQKDATTYASGTSLTQRTTYAYDPANQGNAQYGNQTEQIEYDANFQPYRRTRSVFYPNTTQWIVGKPGYKNVDQYWPGPAGTCPTAYTMANNIGWCLVNSTWYSYDGHPGFSTSPGTLGQLTAVRAWSGVIPARLIDTVYTYDTWGNRLTETTFGDLGTGAVFASANPQTTTTAYDGLYHLYPVQVTNAKGQTTQTAYDYAQGVPMTVTNPNGVVTGYRYDSFGRLKQVIKPGDTPSIPTTEYQYYDFEQPLRIRTNAREVSGCVNCVQPSQVFYDGLGRDIQTKVESQNGAQNIVVEKAYDALGRVAGQTQPRYQPETATSYNKYTPALIANFENGVDNRGWLYAPSGLQSAGPYYAWETPASLAGDDVNYWDVYSDGDGQDEYVDYVLSLKPQDWTGYDQLKIKFYTWCDNGCNGNRKIRMYIHDADGTGNSDGNGYQNLGDYTDGAYTINLAGATNRDQIDQVIIRVSESFFSSLTVANARQRTHLYSLELGNASIGSAGLAWTTNQYDALSRPITTTAPDGTVTRYVYENTIDNGRTLAVKNVFDANRHRTQYRSDAFGQLVKVLELSGDCSPSNWPDASFGCGGAYNTPWGVYGTTQYAYNVLGNLTTVTDTLGNVTNMTYNALSQKTGMSDPDMGHWTYQYDVAGNLITQTDALNNALWFKYDELNRLIEKRQTNSGGNRLAQYTYDQGANGIGHRTSLSDLSGNTAWTYDLRGRMTQETKVISNTGGGTFTTQYGYDTMDRVITTTYPGGNAGQIGEQVNFAYNNANQLNSVTGASPYVQSTTYDAAGRVDYRVLGSNVLQQDYVYYPWTTYKGNGRLQQIKTGTLTPNNPTSLQDLNYTYDGVGNVLTILDNKAGPQTQTFTYDALDRLQTAQASGGTGGTYGTETYLYDPIGNLTSKAGATQWYSDTVHKHAITHLNGVQKFWYDTNGNMTTRNDGTGNFTQQWDKENRLITVTGSATGYFVYDGDGNRVKATLNGVTTAYVGNYYEQSGSVTTTYYYAGGTRIAMRQGNTVNYLLGDHLGSTSITANNSGGLYAELRYKPWGEERYTNGVTTPTRRQYTGQIKDSEIGLYFYGARMYSPYLNRWLSPDTIVPDSKNPQSLNRYSYVNNRPLNFTDPTGHDPYGCEDHANESGCDSLLLNRNVNPLKGAILILACGDGTDCVDLQNGEAAYNNQVPLTPLARQFQNFGGTVIYATGSVQNQKNLPEMEGGISAAIPSGSGPVYLAGHSLGANAVVATLHQGGQNPAIKGVALLDPDLADPGSDPNQTRDDSQAAGGQIVNMYPTMLVTSHNPYVRTQASPENSWPSPISSQMRHYTYDGDHTHLAVNETAAWDIMQFFLAPSWLGEQK